MPPGTRALAFASRWFDPATVHRTFEPLIADWQREWLEASTARRFVVQVKGLLAFWVAAFVSTPAIVRARSPKSLTLQVARRIAWVTLLGTAVMMAPFAGQIAPAWARGLLILFAIPGALVLAFPFAMIAAVDAIRAATNLEPHVARATTAKLAALAVMFMVFTHGWLMPASNQLWRETMMRATSPPPPGFRGEWKPARGVRELTTFELMTSPDLAVAREIGAYPRAAAIVREINSRAALAALPVLLLWRRWRALDLPSGRWFSPQHTFVATISMIFAFLMLRFSDRFVEEAWHMPAGSGPWITLALLMMFSTIRITLAERTIARA